MILICSFLLTACGGEKEYQTTNTELYLQTEGHIANVGTIENTYMIYLNAEYPNPELYETEIERLEKHL